MKKRIFLAYAFQDRALISAAITLLRKADFTALDSNPVLIDPSDSGATASDLRGLLRDGVKTSSLIILFWSKQASASQWVRYELGMARAFEAAKTVPLNRRKVNLRFGEKQTVVWRVQVPKNAKAGEALRVDLVHRSILGRRAFGGIALEITVQEPEV